jgi:hypothetical protein
MCKYSIYILIYKIISSRVLTYLQRLVSQGDYLLLSLHYSLFPEKLHLTQNHKVRKTGNKLRERLSEPRTHNCVLKYVFHIYKADNIVDIHKHNLYIKNGSTS